MNEDERRKIADEAEANGYVWEVCVGCGRSDKEYGIKTGFAMLIWHTSKGPMCEYCYGESSED